MTDKTDIDLRETDSRGKKPAAFTQAVALGYDRATDDAPMVLASGRGAAAEQILAIAFDRGIKVREDAELVEILSLVDVDSPIPLEAFAAVAEILAYVYQANAALKPRGKESHAAP
ncbi:MAG: EscU/YscU/HrcU family type III secretion system export apparatus switch protein [Rickettsiales bacterium]